MLNREKTALAAVRQAVDKGNRAKLLKLVQPGSAFAWAIELANSDFLRVLCPSNDLLAGAQCHRLTVAGAGISGISIRTSEGRWHATFSEGEDQIELVGITPVDLNPSEAFDLDGTSCILESHWPRWAFSKAVSHKLLSNPLVKGTADLLETQPLAIVFRVVGESLAFAKALSKIGIRLEVLHDRRTYNLIYRGIDPDGDPVAIKWMAEARGDMVSQFEREIALLSRFSRHEGFPDLVYSGIFLERRYHVCKWVKGELLRSRRTRLSDDDWQIKLQLTEELLALVAHLHDEGVVHRDVAPDHLVVLDTGALKLLDFGMSAIREGLDAEEWRLLVNNDHSNLGLVLFEIWVGGKEFTYGDARKLREEWAARRGDLDRADLPDEVKETIRTLVLASHRFASNHHGADG